jgi:hypothetical protein
MLFAGVVLKFVPVIVTVEPIPPEVGSKPVIVGEPGGVTVKSAELVAVCPPTSTVIFPEIAPAGTAATMLVDVGVPLILATVPLNLTILLAGVVLKFVPVIVTEVPTGPEIGLKLVMVGAPAAVTVKSAELVPV